MRKRSVVSTRFWYRRDCRTDFGSATSPTSRATPAPRPTMDLTSRSGSVARYRLSAIVVRRVRRAGPALRNVAEFAIRKVRAEFPKLRLEVGVHFALLRRRKQLGRAALRSFPDHRTSLGPGAHFPHMKLVVDALHVLEGRQAADIVDERVRGTDAEKCGDGPDGPPQVPLHRPERQHKNIGPLSLSPVPGGVLGPRPAHHEVLRQIHPIPGLQLRHRSAVDAVPQEEVTRDEDVLRIADDRD